MNTDETRIDPDSQCRDHGCARWRCDAKHPAPPQGDLAATIVRGSALLDAIHAKDWPRTDAEWAAVALAALDQASAPAAIVDRLFAELRSAGLVR